MPPDTDYRPNQRSYNRRTGKHVQITIRRYAEMWPTPTASEAINVVRPVFWRGRSPRFLSNQGVEGQARIGDIVGGQLNPTWIEWLMGYPPNFTKVD
jgi:hypothetical protein